MRNWSPETKCLAQSSNPHQLSRAACDRNCMTQIFSIHSLFRNGTDFLSVTWLSFYAFLFKLNPSFNKKKEGKKKQELSFFKRTPNMFFKFKSRWKNPRLVKVISHLSWEILISKSIFRERQLLFISWKLNIFTLLLYKSAKSNFFFQNTKRMVRK